CLALSVRSLLAEWIFRKGTQESAARAISVDPGNAWLRERAADGVAGNERRDLLAAAVALDPHRTSARTKLSLDAEFEGRFAEAARLLEEAYAYDRMFVTRWNLANFYFRRGDRARFWKW